MKLSAPRRVLLTADASDGVWGHAIEHARALSGRGVEVGLAVLGEALGDEQRAEAAVLPGLALRESALPVESPDAGAWLLALEEELGPDVVHLNHGVLGALPLRAPRLVVAHEREATPPARLHSRDELRRGLAGADWVAAPTRALLEALRAEHGPFARSSVVPNGRDPTRLAPGRKEPMILSCGALWGDTAHVRVLEEIAPRLTWPVLIAGEAPPSPGRKVRLLGPQGSKELSRYYARAAIYALPARYEPVGLRVLEAALSGCALVLGKIPSLEESWKSAAFFLPPDEPMRLQELLLHLMMDPALLGVMARRARTRALRFGAEQMTQTFLGIYRELCTRERRDDDDGVAFETTSFV